jgi:hypothetical protein
MLQHHNNPLLQNFPPTFPAFVGLFDQQSGSRLMLVKNTNIG